MRATRSPKAVSYAAASGALLLLAVVAGRPALVALAAPFLGGALLAVRSGRPAAVAGGSSLSTERAVEGDLVDLVVSVSPSPGLAWATVTPTFGDGLVLDRSPPAITTRLHPRHPTDVRFRLRCRRWGAFRTGAEIVGHDRTGSWRTTMAWTSAETLRVHPTTTRLRRLVPARRTGASGGSHVSRHLGEGLEFAEVRPFVAGDSVRSVNWRATARRGDLWVTERHPERASDVVVFLDTFGPPGAAREDTLGLAVEAVTVLAERHLAAGDRVGLVDLGGVLRWLPPSIGSRQLHQITEMLLASEIVETFADKGADVLPTHAFPVGAVVLAFTPLADRRTVATLLDLRARGFDLAIVECRPAAPLPPGLDDVARLAERLWQLEREAVRDQFRHLGVAVVPWTRPHPLEPVIDQVIELRRRPQRAATS
jgi:uncharacterized protein (DUF58 family)